MVAAHCNNRQAAFFRPHRGRLCEDTEDAIQAAEEGDLTVRFPWYRDGNAFHGATPQQDQGYRHPVTGQFNRYCLYDRLHETNTKQRAEILRRLTFVPEMNGIVNTQAAEQIHSSIKRDLHFLNNMGPITHIFTTRLISHLRNQEINKAARTEIEKRVGSGTTILDNTGRIALDFSKKGDVQDQTEGANNRAGLSSSDDPSQSQLQPQGEDTRGRSIPHQAQKLLNKSSCINNRNQGDMGGAQALVPKGLTNPGDNRCYANAAIQCLLAAGFEDHIELNDSDFLRWLRSFMTSHLQLGKPGTVSTRELIRKIRQQFSALQSCGQHDGFEFIELLMEPLKDAWAIEFSVSTECLNCLQNSQTPARVRSLLLTTAATDSTTLTITELLGLRLFVADLCTWRDLPCQVRGHEGYIQREITSAGNLLVIALGRYDDELKKDHRPVEIEQNLSIAKDLRYTLVAVLCHHAESLYSGHYTAWTYREGRWFKCDDTTVTEQDSIVNNMVATSSYVFFYTKSSSGTADALKQSTIPLPASGPASGTTATKHSMQGFMLNAEENREVDLAFSTDSECNDVVAELNNLKVLREDIKSLDEQQLVNDKVIDVFMEIACNMCSGSSSTLVCSVSVLNFTKWKRELESGTTLTKSCLLRKIDFSKMDRVLVPINVQDGEHWYLLVLDRVNKSIRSYDSWSKNTVHPDALDIVRRYFSQRDGQLGKKDFAGIDGWPIDFVKYPLQQDSSSCGAFVCLYAMQECGLVPALDTVNSRDLRRFIAHKVLENKPSFRPASGGLTESAGERTEVEAILTDEQQMLGEEDDMIVCGEPVLLLDSPDSEISIKTPEGVTKVYKKK
ncbi:uncharacterized protein LOC144882806 [Branchiostoma floridae x Branchiostoma japonicum]